MAFNCTSCGECCKHMDVVLNRPAPYAFLQRATDAFPYGFKENGHCEKLDGNTCTVYDNRPLLCNIDRLAKQADLPMIPGR